MSQPKDAPHTVTRGDFRSDRAKVLEVAASGRRVVITDDKQRATTIVSTPRNKLPSRFD